MSLKETNEYLSLDSEEQLPLPVEPIYTIKQSKLLLPCSSEKALYCLLYRYKDNLSEASYIRMPDGQKKRVLTASDLRHLRDQIVTKGWFTGKYKNYKNRNKKEDN